LIADTGKSLGSPITIKAFVRFALGDGIEKKVDDFAAEVSAMTSGQA
jgi:elongation factor Ts